MNEPIEGIASGFCIAATPIGNLGDITLRVLKALGAAELILAEDTRRTRKLLTHYKIKPKKLISYHEHSAVTQKLIENVVEIVENGGLVVLVSDAGTPLISDPGFALLRELIALDVNIFSLPGASSPIAALSVAGIPTHRFSFGGFLPNKTNARKKYLKSFISENGGALVFFESPHRLKKAINDMVEVFGENKKIIIAREMTKKFEELKRGTLVELANYYDEKIVKGEITIVIEL